MLGPPPLTPTCSRNRGHLAISDRFFFITDRAWHTSARVRAFASPAELEVIDSGDDVVAAWETGKPMLDEWGPRVRQLRDLIQRSATGCCLRRAAWV